jgi:hypothetical protein
MSEILRGLLRERMRNEVGEVFGGVERDLKQERVLGKDYPQE